MNAIEIAGWALLMLAGLVGSAMWSGTETGFYCLSRVRLDVRLHKRGDRAALRVRDELSDPNRLLSTVLLGNNLCNYAGTLGLTMLLAGSGLSPGATIVLQMVVLTPLLLVFGESLPKEVFRLNADSWPYALSPVIKFVRILATVTLVLPALMAISRLALRLTGDTGGSIDAMGRRRRLLGLLEESAHSGSISGLQGRLAERALVFERTTVGEVAVPWRSVDRIRVDWSNETASAFALRTTRTWLPVTDRLGRVRGVIHALDLIASSGEIGHGEGPEMIEPVRLDASESVLTAIGKLAVNPAGIAIVVDRARAGKGERVVGLVGREDLVGPLLAGDAA